MDIAGLSMTLSQSKALNDVGTAVLSKTMDQQENMGAGIVNMIDSAAMERSVNPAVGSNFDFKI